MTFLFIINICTHTITFSSIAHVRILNIPQAQFKREFPYNLNRFALVNIIYYQNLALLTF